MDRGGAAAHGIRRLAGACGLAAALLLPAAAEGANEPPARMLFGKIEAPSDSPATVIGSYAKGCIAGAAALAEAGPGYQTMRPSRNRAWGHPVLVAFLEGLAADMAAEGHATMLVGDLAQPRGGPMMTGHASHQSGLDADVWFRPGLDRPLTVEEREQWSAHSVVQSVEAPWVTEKFTPREARMIELAARDRRSERIFVAPPIKKALCEAAPADDRSWLRKVRPWYGHKDHMHVRLACPAGDLACTAQAAPPAGDGCGEELTSWLTPPKPAKPVAKPKTPKTTPKKREILLSQLPEACAALLTDAPKP